MLIWLFLALILVCVAVGEFYHYRTGVPTVSSFPSARLKVIEAVRHISGMSAKKDLTIMDLGSGRGGLTQKLGRAVPEARVIGLEISYFPWFYSYLLQKLSGPSNVQYLRKDFWTVPCDQIDVIVLYLTENIIERVGEKLWRELKTGAYVIANDTNLRGEWVPVETYETGLLGMKVYLYRR